MLRNIITKFSVMQTQSKKSYLIPEYFQNNLNWGGGGIFANLLQNKNSVINFSSRDMLSPGFFLEEYS